MEIGGAFTTFLECFEQFDVTSSTELFLPYSPRSLRIFTSVSTDYAAH